MDNILNIVVLKVVSFDFSELCTLKLLSLSVQPVANLLLLAVHPVLESLLQPRLSCFYLLAPSPVSLDLLPLHCDI
jgi:hypothetical protein